MPRARIYASHTELLRAEAGNVDFVDIATPPYAHAEVAHAALGAGLHVLCEKPVAISSDEAQSMAEHADRARRVFYPCHNYKHAPVIKAVRSILERGTVGKIHLVTLQTFRTTHARGTRDWRPDWRRERMFAGGGIAMDHGSHTFYLAFEWLRSHPTSMGAKTFNSDGADTEDNFSCTLTFPTGIASAHLTWTAGARKVLYTLHGDRGAITVDDDVIEVLSRDGSAHDESQSVPSQWMDASHKEWFSSLLDQFAQAIDRRDFVSHDTLDALQCVRVISAGYASAARGGREVNLTTPLTLQRSNGSAVAGARTLRHSAAFRP